MGDRAARVEIDGSRGVSSVVWIDVEICLSPRGLASRLTGLKNKALSIPVLCFRARFWMSLPWGNFPLARPVYGILAIREASLPVSAVRENAAAGTPGGGNRRDAAMKKWMLPAVAGMMALPCLMLASARAQSVATYHNSANRSGLYTGRGLTFGAAANMHLDSGFDAALAGNVYAQPLYWEPSGAGGALASLQVSSAVIVTEPTIYRASAYTIAALTNFNGSRANCSGNNRTALKIVAAEGDNQLHAFHALTAKELFSGGGVTMNGLHHFSTLIAANHHLYVAGDGAVYAFTF
jgi:hypothetical protein